jgi:HPt (histidine-containing phosphotransfer) domain-containing protein
VPIFALSAHAFNSDMQASLDAGCDRHLTKPVSRATLLEALASVRPLAPKAAPPGGPGPEPAASSAHGESAGVVDAAAAIQRIGGDAQIYERLLDHARVFVVDWPGSFERAIAAGDADRACRLTHDLKSVAATIGAQRLADAARALEEAFGRPPHVSAALTPARGALDAAIAPVILELTRGRMRSGVA